MAALAILLLVSLLPLHGAAHDPGLSQVRVVVRPDALEAEIVIPWGDSDPDASLLGEHGFTVRIDRGALALLGSSVRRFPGDRIELDLRFALRDSSPGVLELESRMLASLPFGHKQFVRVFAADGSALASGVLSAYAPSLELRLRRSVRSAR
jgi:hypothetical protein